jgi:serine/threonine protein kinase
MRDSSVTLEVLTPAYAPPEMFRHDNPSGAVDVYALSATLYAVMRGRPPRWDGDRSPSLITLMDLFNHPIPDLPGVPRALTEVLRYGMANDPASRPTAEQLRELLIGVQLPSPPGPPPTFQSHGSTFIPPPRMTPVAPGDDTPTVHAPLKQPKKKRFFGLLGIQDR